MWSLVSEYLLRKSDSLEIKNFGKFTATNYDATIDSENKILKPAGRKFAFIPAGTKTDEEFIQFVTDRLKKSIPEIERLMEKALLEADTKLKNGEKVDLPHIGYLFAPDKQNPTLVQTAQYSLHPDNFGYTEIELPYTGKSTKPRSRAKATSPTPKKTVKKQTTSRTSKTKTTPKPKKEKEKATINWTKTFKYAAIITALAAIFAVIIAYRQPIIDFSKGILTPKTTKQQVVKTNTNNPTQPSTPKKQTQKQQTSASTKTEVTTQKATPTTEQQANPPQPKPQQTIPAPADTALLSSIKIRAHIPIGSNYKKYYLIVGSFLKKENAENFKQKLRYEGYPALILSFGPNRHRVSIGGYNDPMKVIKAYNDYVNRHPGKGIWLLINNEQ